MAIEAEAENLFVQLRQRIDELVTLRTQAERAMEDLKDDYNLSVPATRLRLRPWSLKRGLPPYAVYWIFVNLRRKLAETVLDRAIERLKPRRFVRFKVGERRRLRWGIFHGGLAAERRTVLAFDREAASLNEAHRVAARALDSLRKMLDSRSGGAYDSTRIPLMPRDCYSDCCPRELHRLYGLHWRFAHVLLAAGSSLRDLADRLRHERLPGGLRLKFRRNPEHPFGQLLWSGAGGRVAFSKLTGKNTRMLRLRSGDRKIIARIERDRRPRVRWLGSLTRLLKRLRMKTLTAIGKAKQALARGVHGHDTQAGPSPVQAG